MACELPKTTQVVLLAALGRTLGLSDKGVDSRLRQAFSSELDSRGLDFSFNVGGPGTEPLLYGGIRIAAAEQVCTDVESIMERRFEKVRASDLNGRSFLTFAMQPEGRPDPIEVTITSSDNVIWFCVGERPDPNWLSGVFQESSNTVNSVLLVKMSLNKLADKLPAKTMGTNIERALDRALGQLILRYLKGSGGRTLSVDSLEAIEPLLPRVVGESPATFELRLNADPRGVRVRTQADQPFLEFVGLRLLFTLDRCMALAAAP